MSYVKIENGVPLLYTFSQLKKDNPNVSFPREPSASILADYGVYVLQQDPKPRAEIVEKGPIEERNGEWWQTYTGRDETPDEYRADMVVTMRQARLALLQENKLADVTSAISALPDGEREAAEIQWEYGSEVERLSTLVVALTSAIGLTDEAMDDLFRLAETL